MGYGMNLVNFRNGRQVPIPRDEIINILGQHGCLVAELQEGINVVGLPCDDPFYSPFGESAILAVKHGEVTEFGLSRPQATAECKALLFALIHQMGLTMFPDFGKILYAREGVFDEVPKDILAQFTELIVVRSPGDCR